MASSSSIIGHDIPVARLSIISLPQLRTRDPATLALLDEAATNTGFFYLDLRGDTHGTHVLENLSHIYQTVENYFNQSTEVKESDARLDTKPSQDLGWKSGHGGESFEISRDEARLNGASISQLPQIFRDDWKMIMDFSAGCDDACLTLLGSLSADFTLHHRVDQPSDTGLKFVSHPSLTQMCNVGDSGLHTDSGTLTLLFHKDLSIRAFLPDSGSWAFAPPLEGCALVNIGDSLQRLSNGRLHSAKHGVTQTVDGVRERYYLSYFLRPETALIESLEYAK